MIPDSSSKQLFSLEEARTPLFQYPTGIAVRCPRKPRRRESRSKISCSVIATKGLVIRSRPFPTSIKLKSRASTCEIVPDGLGAWPMPALGKEQALQMFARLSGRFTRVALLFSPIVFITSTPFSAAHFLGHGFGPIPARSGFAASAFPVPPERHRPPHKAPARPGAAASRIWVPQENEASKKEKNSCLTKQS